MSTAPDTTLDTALTLTEEQAAELRALAALMDRVKSHPAGRKLITDILLAVCAEAGLAVVDKQENDRIIAVLQRVKVREIGGKLFIGVIIEDGCWSAPIDADGRRIFEAWEAERAEALGLAEASSAPSTARSAS